MKFLLALCFISFSAGAQIHYTIDAEFRVQRPCKNIFVYYKDEQRIDTLNFSDVHLKGQLGKPGLVSFRLDSFAFARVWVDEGAIKFRYENTAITFLQGPDDTRLFNELAMPRQFRYDFPLGTPQVVKDSTVKAGQAKFASNLIDSLIKLKPNSGVIPYYINYYIPDLGREKVAELFYRLPPSTRQTEQGKTVLKYLTRSYLLQKGTTVEDFQMPSADGKMVKLSDVPNKYILLDFWASWCGPCRSEHPGLVSAYNEFRDKDFTIISISLDNDKADWLAAIKKDGLSWTNLSDLRGWRTALASKYKITTIPFNVLLDQNRNIIAVGLRGSDLRKVLSEKLTATAGLR